MSELLNVGGQPKVYIKKFKEWMRDKFILNRILQKGDIVNKNPTDFMEFKKINKQLKDDKNY